MENQAPVIRHFRGDFEYLSNFYTRSPFVDECETTWKTVEHFYQAAKTTNPEWIYDIYKAPDPATAKALGSKCPLRKDWKLIKDRVMYDAIYMKAKVLKQLMREL